METIRERKMIDEETENLARQFTSWINSTCPDKYGLAYALTKQHRYLVGKTMDVAMLFIIKLYDDYKNGRYDERDENACKLAKFIIEALQADDKYKSSYDDWSLSKMIDRLNDCLLNCNLG